MKNKFFILFLLARLFFVTVSLQAQNIELDEIVVTPSRIEQSSRDSARKVDIITALDIEQSQSGDLGEALNKINVLDISNYGGPGATRHLRMRGSTDAQVLVLIDGRPMNSPRDGAVDLSLIPMDNVSRVEVMHGAGSSLYGTSAMGGTVNIITKSPPKSGQKTEVFSSFGTFRTYNERLSQGARLKQLAYLLTLGYQSSQGFRANSELNQKDFNAKFEYDLNECNKLSVNSGFFNSFTGARGPISAPDTDDKQKNLKNFVDLNWSFKPELTSEFKARIYNNYDRLEFIENSAGSIFDIPLSKSTHTTKVKGSDLQLNKKFTEFYQLICGLNYVSNLNDSTSSAKHKYDVKAGYLNNEFDLFRKLKISLSGRVDDYSNFGTEFNPSFSFLYRFLNDNTVHGVVSRSFRAPTFNDLYWPDEGWARGNPDIKPEKGITAELGFDLKINKYILTGITYYRNKYSQLINWAEEAGVWQPRNVGSAVIDGIELESQFFISEHIQANLGYTFLRAIDEKLHKELIYQPKNKVDFSLKYKLPGNFSFEVKTQFTGQRYHDAANTVKVKPFFVMGFNLSKKFRQHFTYYMTVDNLLAKKYQVIRDYPMPGFSITNGIKCEF